jgi:hypothetical protein
MRLLVLFILSNHFSSTTVPGLTQPLTEMSTSKSFLGVEGGRYLTHNSTSLYGLLQGYICLYFTFISCCYIRDSGRQFSSKESVIVNPISITLHTTGNALDQCTGLTSAGTPAIWTEIFHGCPQTPMEIPAKYFENVTILCFHMLSNSL